MDNFSNIAIKLQLPMADWSQFEVEAIVADYFDMLRKELSGISFNKSEHRRGVLKVVNRSEGSIEFKHQNISAILVENGAPYVVGYMPRYNYQDLLAEVVLAYLKKHNSLQADFNSFATKKIEVNKSTLAFEAWSVEAPEKSKGVREPSERYYRPVKKNYLEIEQENRSTGQSGEELVFDYEKWRLKKAGLPELAKKVQWVSKDLGDGAGFDILSRNIKGAEIFIEVKSTKLGKETPIFYSRLENDFSNEKQSSFFLYRVFNLEREPKLFTCNGPFQSFCNPETHIYKGYF